MTAALLVVLGCTMGVALCGVAVLLARRSEPPRLAGWLRFRIGLVAVGLLGIAASVLIKGIPK